MLHVFDILFPPREDEKILRTVSDDEFLSLVAPRLVGTTRPGTVALLPFQHSSVRSAIHEAKYHGNQRAFRLLALALADYLRDTDDVGRTTSYIAIVPVPLGEKRRKERGFNQAEEVVRKALCDIDKNVFELAPRVLERTRETVSQISLPRREREKNMRGAFGATHPLDPSRTYIIIDDVLTTGATLQAAIDALIAAGVESDHIIPIALAH